MGARPIRTLFLYPHLSPGARTAVIVVIESSYNPEVGDMKMGENGRPMIYLNDLAANAPDIVHRIIVNKLIQDIENHANKDVG